MVYIYIITGGGTKSTLQRGIMDHLPSVPYSTFTAPELRRMDQDSPETNGLVGDLWHIFGSI